MPSVAKPISVVAGAFHKMLSGASLMKYYVVPETRDGCAFPTVPKPMELKKVSAHIAAYLDRFRIQGYFSNCKMERIPLDSLAFRIVPADDSHGHLGVMVIP